MKRSMWALILASLVICGCAGRMNTDLLQARIREQAAQLTETQRQVAKTKSELKLSRLEADQLRSELAQTGRAGDLVPRSDLQISKLHIYPLASGGLNKDDLPGDDAVVVQFAPLDQDSEPAKLPGQIQLTLIDPMLPESERELGKWSFSAEECRDHWTRGITSSGFQFTLPLEQSPQHTDLVVKLQFKTADNRRCEANQIIKVMVAPGNAMANRRRPGKKVVQVVDESDEPLPPVGDHQSNSTAGEPSDWDRDERATTPKNAVLHSSSWTDKFPQLR